MQESGEMYLETILVLGKKKNIIRAIDVAEELGFSKPSVSRALSRLKGDEYLLVDTDGYIALTEKGRQLATKIYERHIVLTNLLIRLGVPEKIAGEDACKIEHDISDASFEAIKNYIQGKREEK